MVYIMRVNYAFIIILTVLSYFSIGLKPILPIRFKSEIGLAIFKS